MTAPPPPSPLGPDLLGLYRAMLRIRVFEERVSELYRDGEIPGFVHVCIGQEASAVGVCTPLTADDTITSTHRGHGHCLAKGLDPATMMAELMGRASGTCGGYGGSMHIANPTLGVLGANGIVGAGIPIAVGAGFAAKQRGAGSVSVAFFGDGAVAQGAFHEGLDLAALWHLPVLFACENNHFAEFSRETDQHAAGLAARSAAYGLRHIAVDGGDVVAIVSTVTDIIAEMRCGGPPVLLEIDTYRWHGHYEGDPERYRTKDEVAEQMSRHDPVALARERLAREHTDPAVLEALVAEVRAEIDAALAWARSQPLPDPEATARHVYAPRSAIAERPVGTSSTSYRVMDAVRDALEGALETDERVFVAGVDVGRGGNVFGLTRGLHDRWPRRVLDTPIAETGIVGLAVGAAMVGLRPVVEIMYTDFIGVCFDQILNQAAKLRFMTGGKCEIPLVIRTQFGVGRSSGSQHSQSLEALLAHIPGLTVVMPATPADTFGLLRAAIDDPNPVVFIENRLLYGRKGPQPPPDHLVPIGSARIARPGTDLTIVAWSHGVHDALVTAEQLEADGISAEVLDLRTIQPLDRQAILDSVVRTSRLLVTQQAPIEFGVASEIARLASQEGFWHLDAPVAVVAPPFTPVPYAPNLERCWLPDSDRLAAAARRLVSL